jgi:hypothetical protein
MEKLTMDLIKKNLKPGHALISGFVFRISFSVSHTFIFYVRFEVFTVVTMKKAVFWDVAPCRCGLLAKIKVESDGPRRNLE